MHARDIWEGKGFGPVLARAVLTPFSWLYALGWRGYELVYKSGWKRAVHPHSPIICIGNLTVGGTGKTPVTMAVVQALIDSGRLVVVGASGYGSAAAEGASLAPNGSLSALTWGDEPALFREEFPDVPIIVGRARVKAAEICAAEFPNSVLVMDDGFQHLPLSKDICIVLDPPATNHLCLPAGPYREPRSGLCKADLILPGAFELVHSPLLFDRPPPEEAVVMSAIGQPALFIQGVVESGVRVVRTITLGDHDDLQGGTLFDTIPPGVPIIVTAKDWVKLRERGDLDKVRIIVARRKTTISRAPEFASWLTEKLDDKETHVQQ